MELHQIPTKPSTISYNKKDGYLWVAQFSVAPVAGDTSEDEDSDEEVEEMIPVHRVCMHMSTMQRQTN